MRQTRELTQMYRQVHKVRQCGEGVKGAIERKRGRVEIQENTESDAQIGRRQGDMPTKRETQIQRGRTDRQYCRDGNEDRRVDAQKGRQTDRYACLRVSD